MGRKLVNEALLYEYIKDAMKYRALVRLNVEDWSRYYDALDEFKTNYCKYEMIEDDNPDESDNFSSIARYEMSSFVDEDWQNGRR